MKIPCPAEREGFEPPEPFSSTVFKTAVIDHSCCHSEHPLVVILSVSEESGEEGRGLRTANKFNLYLIEIQVITKIDCSRSLLF